MKDKKKHDLPVDLSKDSSTRKLQSFLTIPQLEFSLNLSVGEVFHILDHGGLKEIISEEQILISAKSKEKLYILSDGSKVIVTSRKRIQRPTNIDGVLQIDIEGKLKWESHRLLEKFKEEISKIGLNGMTKKILEAWKGKFNFATETKDSDGNIVSKGLRPPQIGGLHAIGAHWSLYTQQATVVMPTGTGKTETMLATLVNYSPGMILIVVPSKVLRDQTAKKFATLGLLRFLGNLSKDTPNPLVGIIKSRPKSEADLSILENCNVVVTTMSAISGGSAEPFSNLIAKRVGALIVDEAHHVPAISWSKFREKFSESSILQFTATPYRRDGKLVDGKVIYDYPLHKAQQDGYFKKISFEPVYEVDQDIADRTVAEAAVARLKKDILEGYDHLMMVRCASIERAELLLPIYQEIATEFEPVIIHSEAGNIELSINDLKSRKSRIAICVNMLGEGFDFPQLKVAAVHDVHKSLAVLLQFTGRFTRSVGENIGDATIIANIADQEVSSALERLYSEDADWNYLLSEYSSEASKAHTALVEFLNSSERLDKSDGEESVEISHHLLRPTMSTLTYVAPNFYPKKFFEAIPKAVKIQRVWLHQESNTLYFVTRVESPTKWTRSREIRDRQWDLHVLHYDAEQKLLFLSSSDHSSLHEKLAATVGATSLISGDTIFRSLGNINRLMFQNVGVRKHGRRNLSFAMYTGSDVAEALSISERAGSVKSNLSGSGWENGMFVTVGCSYKGRVWSREQGTILEFVNWCERIGKKLQDTTIDTAQIIANVLIPEEISSFPDKKVIGLDWPLEILKQAEERVILKRGEEELPISIFEIEPVSVDISSNTIKFQIRSIDEADIWGVLAMVVGGSEGFKVTLSSTTLIDIQIGNKTYPLETFFSSYPPLVRFVDLSELDGNLLIKPQSTQNFVLPDGVFEIWDWTGVDITKESIWKNGAERKDSIEWRTAQYFIDGGFDIVFDDDSAGEAADLVCFKEEKDHIRLALIHCKFTRGTTPGERVEDVVEVCSQAIRSAKWKWKFKDLCRHIADREKRLAQGQSGRTTRFLKGQPSDLNKFSKASRFKEIRPEIIIVQPGISETNYTLEQKAILAATHSYLKETIGVDLNVICSN